MTGKQLYRLVAGKQTGPYPPEKLRPLVADGRISRLDRFSYDGVDWRSADHFPELMGRAVAAPRGDAATTATASPASTAPATASAGLRPPPPAAGAAARSSASGWLSRPPMVAAGAIGLATLLGVGMYLGLRSGPAGVNDVTDRFDAVAKATESLGTAAVCVRGTYFPQELSPRAGGRDYTIKFRSGGAKRAVVSGDRPDRFTLVVPQAMGNRLMQIIGRLESEQPAIVDLACTQTDAGGVQRPIGRVTKIKFCREAPTSQAAKAFLQLDEDGEIEEE